VEIERDVAAVEDTHDDAFAEHGGQDADTQVHGVAADLEGDTAVLRQTTFGDVEVGHDLDAAGDGHGDVPRRRNHLVEHTVDAVTQLVLALERLEVDVAGLVLDRLQKHEVEQLLDRIRVGELANLLEIDAFAAPLELGEV